MVPIKAVSLDVLVRNKSIKYIRAHYIDSAKPITY